MSASIHCHHPELEYKVVTAIEDGRAFAEVTAARCPFCEKRWRFVGVEHRYDPGMPTANRNATKVLLPMVEILNG